jgi:hypothetical protein
MVAWAERLGTLGEVVAFDYPYARAGRKAPDRFPVLLEAHREALHAARAGHDGPVVLAGKSMGSRIGLHLAVEEDVDAAICFGYPLVARSKAGVKVRDEVLVQQRQPVLFLEGTRDPMCPLATLGEVRDRMTAPNNLLVVEAGDHSLRITKKFARDVGTDQDEVDQGILGTIEFWLGDVLG